MSLASPLASTRRMLAVSLALTGAALGMGCGAVPGQSATALAQTEFAAAAHRSASLRKVPWMQNAVVYGVLPPLCGEQPLHDVTARLDDMKDLGVTVLWLNPINDTDDQSELSYAITDYKAIRKSYGSLADLERLIEQAHQRGIKVVMDFVPNHTSTGHPYFKDAKAKGAKSPYWDYYMRDKDGTPQHYFDWTNLINLNYGNAGVQAMITDAFSYWLHAGVDGFRVDAAWGIKQRNPEFWPKLAHSLSAVKPDVFLLAEASARDPYYVTSGFDAAYDWTKDLGHGAWEHAFDDAAKVGDRLRENNGGRETPPERVARFLANNDTGARFITRHGEAMQRVAATLLLTMPGLPMVYAGDEVGAEFDPNDDPKPLRWADPHHLRPLYKHLADLRHHLSALHAGTFNELKLSNMPGTYAYARDAGGQAFALVVLNFGDARTVEIDLPMDHAADKLSDALGGLQITRQAGRHLTMAMPKAGAVILVPTR